MPNDWGSQWTKKVTSALTTKLRGGYCFYITQGLVVGGPLRHGVFAQRVERYLVVGGECFFGGVSLVIGRGDKRSRGEKKEGGGGGEEISFRLII